MLNVHSSPDRGSKLSMRRRSKISIDRFASKGTTERMCGKEKERAAFQNFILINAHGSEIHRFLQAAMSK